ncbi:hypothetical protein WJX74_008260 [Apatococcus lobatus]|uniref:Bromo domain-containing protein n=1 Tax=Apatococcus lobatus TaxID=904363 RepID=A0AAW1QXY8_9CHLO
MDIDHKKRAQKALKTLMGHEIAISYFNEPVDADALGIPEYRDIIKRPMDLGTVSHKLQGNRYRGLYDVRADINLIWRNCQAFNEPGSDVYEESKQLAAVFDRLWSSSGLSKLEVVARTEAEAAKASRTSGPPHPSYHHQHHHHHQQQQPRQRMPAALPAGSHARASGAGSRNPAWPQTTTSKDAFGDDFSSSGPRQRLDAVRSRQMLDLATGAVSRGLDAGMEGMPGEQHRSRGAQPGRRTLTDTGSRAASDAAPGQARSGHLPWGQSDLPGPASNAGRSSQKFMQLSSVGERQSGQARGARAAHPLHRCLNVISQLLQDPDVVQLLDNGSQGTSEGPLEQVRAALHPGVSNGWGTVAFKSTGEVLADVRPIFQAALSKFQPHSQQWMQCKQVEEVFNAGWLQAGLSFEAASIAPPPRNPHRHPGDNLGSPSAGGPQSLKRRMSAAAFGVQSDEDDEAPQKMQRKARSQRVPRPVQKPDMIDALDPEFGEDGERGRDRDGRAEDQAGTETTHTRPCEVCRRAKKGKCGSWTSMLGCLRRAENGLPSRSSGVTKSRSQETGPHVRDDVPATDSSLHQLPPQGEQHQALGTRVGLRRGLASHHSATRGSVERPQGPGPPPGLEGIPWPLTKEAAAELGLPAPDPQKEAAEVEAIAAWQRLQKQRRKLPELEAAALESARKLTEAQAVLAEVTKAEEAAEAERQAALALEPWPPDARLAPSSPQPQPPAQVLLQHPHPPPPQGGGGFPSITFTCYIEICQHWAPTCWRLLSGRSRGSSDRRSLIIILLKSGLSRQVCRLSTERNATLQECALTPAAQPSLLLSPPTFECSILIIAEFVSSRSLVRAIASRRLVKRALSKASCDSLQQSRLSLKLNWPAEAQQPGFGSPCAAHLTAGAARAALRPTQAPGHSDATPVRVAIPNPMSPVSDELLTPGQFTQPSPNPSTEAHSIPETRPSRPQSSNGLHVIAAQQGNHMHAQADQAGVNQAGASAPQPAAEGKQQSWEGVTPPSRNASPMPDALSASDDAAPLSRRPSLSLEDVPVRRQTIRTHGTSHRQRATLQPGNGSSHAASDFHSTFSDQQGSASRSRSPPARSPHQPPHRDSSPPLRPASFTRDDLAEIPHAVAAENSSRKPTSRRVPPKSPRQQTSGSINHPADSPAEPQPDILGLLETGAQPPAAFYDNEHTFTIEPPSLDELDPEEQITPHDIPSPLKATSRRTLFLQQGLPVGESRSSRSLAMGGLPEDQSAKVDLSEEKREQQQEHIRHQLEAFVMSSRRNSQRYLSHRSMDPLTTVTALQGSSTHSQDVATSEGRQSPSPHHRSPTRHHTPLNPHSISASPLGMPPPGSLPRTRSSSRPPSRSRSERRRRGEQPRNNEPLGVSPMPVSGHSKATPEPEHVAAHVTANVQHPLQHATSAPQPVSPVSAPTDVVEAVQELPAQISSPIVVEGPDVGTGRGVPWEDSARELEGHGPGGKSSPADKTSQQHSKPGHHTSHHAHRINTRSKVEPAPEGEAAATGTDSKIQAEFVEAAKRAKVLQTRQRLKSTGSASLAEGGAEALKLLDARRDKRMDPRERTLLWLQSVEAHEEEPAPKLPSPTPSAPSSIATATTGVGAPPTGTPRVNSRKRQEGIGRLGVAKQPGCVAFGGSGQTSGKQRSGRFAWLQCFGATAVRGE